MSEQEGVAKYHLEFSPGPGRAFPGFGRLDGWRTLLHRLRLIGQDPTCYGGLGYGNISQRIGPFDFPLPPLQFIISGTQTGHLERLGVEHFSTVLAADPHRNRVVAEGPVEPSSEALTHAAVYASNEQARYVLHVHSPEIWSQTQQLKIPATPRDVPYGTPQMAAAVHSLLCSVDVENCPIFSMLGHDDGIVSFGRTLDQAGQILIRYLALALSGIRDRETGIKL
jgi:Class II Aldolase and Adducin N-terminal domain